MAKIILRSLLLGSLFYGLSSCSTDEAAKPTYLQIDALHLETDYAEEGTAHTNISTVWLSANGEIIGAFELPALIPVVLREGQNELRISAGINTNGISSFRAINTSFDPIIYNLDYQSSGEAPDTIIIPEGDLITHYRDFYQVSIVEDFDDPGLNFQRTNFSDTNFIKVDDADSIFHFQPFNSNQAEPNNNSGLIILDDLNPQVELSSVVSYEIPAGTQNIFLEVTYRTNAQVGFGLVANLATGDQSDITAGVLPKEEWSKIYINLVTEFQAFPGASGYQILIRAKKPDNVDQARIYLDNLKLVYIP
ncbi:hypothetical protein [Croceimicrobium hydrocarbonivorans]|uniref:Uncharacterized protein n=1 Tax=Croceimicrobium hydrocarbonivorans TaxID=2761580 RepID=A0A7H0VDH1_9FLAO|nr:hypothetical protein [Croceimicrobium hydrocarbonivorans]QNR23769.1 hypothetical protein H4K34_15530 [Croceimicrobium hydrocarbonivorans]